MTTDYDEASAEKLVDDIINRYMHVMTDPDMREAVIVKAIALVALAYGIPPVVDKPLDVNEVLERLTYAEHVLAGRVMKPTNATH